MNYIFASNHVIVLAMRAASNPKDTQVEMLVLDPTSKSPLPDKAFLAEDLQNLIKEMRDLDFPYHLKSVGLPEPIRPPEQQKQPVQDGGTSKGAIIGGVFAAILVIIGVVFVIWFYTRRRRNKRYFNGIKCHTV